MMVAGGTSSGMGAASGRTRATSTTSPAARREDAVSTSPPRASSPRWNARAAEPRDIPAVSVSSSAEQSSSARNSSRDAQSVHVEKLVAHELFCLQWHTAPLTNLADARAGILRQPTRWGAAPSPLALAPPNFRTPVVGKRCNAQPCTGSADARPYQYPTNALEIEERIMAIICHRMCSETSAARQLARIPHLERIRHVGR